MALEAGVVGFICTFLGLNILRTYKKSTPFFCVYDSHWMEAIFLPCLLQPSEGEEVPAYSQEQLKASQELWALCSVEEENIYFGLESYCFNYQVIS